MYALGRTAPGLSPQNDIPPEADRMKTGNSLGDAFGKTRLCFEVSSRHLQLYNNRILLMIRSRRWFFIILRLK